eukprot:TRINITY_DN106598_c0_g1_i1.p1 TRINITY_DN106598_c0_g1~~TRINITY_DN106598_c0_g1_i1.p1  ORF type:complete len:105 (+),score=14.64 TRINITY_DN106598_c0_g1_i1:653-967(+)
MSHASHPHSSEMSRICTERRHSLMTGSRALFPVSSNDLNAVCFAGGPKRRLLKNSRQLLLHVTSRNMSWLPKRLRLSCHACLAEIGSSRQTRTVCAARPPKGLL